jgi:hypothetical protein
MDGPGVDGAVAAATYFLSLYPYVYNTGDLAQWKAMSHPECVFCASVVTGVEEMVAKGNHQEGASVTFESSSGRELDPGAAFVVDLQVRQEPTTEVSAVGSVVDEIAEAKLLSIAMSVRREGDRWLIRASEAVVVSE